ncbi:MAG: hypothetical protein R3F33_01005 [Planctomycetota bacterium]
MESSGAPRRPSARLINSRPFVLIGNGDLHGKNISVQVAEGKTTTRL